MSESLNASGFRLVLQSFNLTEAEDEELRMIAARNKMRKSELLRGAVAIQLAASSCHQYSNAPADNILRAPSPERAAKIVESTAAVRSHE